MRYIRALKNDRLRCEFVKVWRMHAASSFADNGVRAELIWKKVHGNDRPFRLESDPPFEHDVQKRIPDVRKAKRVLRFEATTTLDQMLDEVIPWIKTEIAAGRV